MNMQEAFDKAYKGVISQGGPSLLPGGQGGCAYRSQDGRKCGVGWLISDESYQPEFDFADEPASMGVAELVNTYDIPELKELPLDFLDSLQMAHDRASEELSEDFMTQFRINMGELARFFSLTVPA